VQIYFAVEVCLIVLLFLETKPQGRNSQRFRKGFGGLRSGLGGLREVMSCRGNRRKRVGFIRGWWWKGSSVWGAMFSARSLESRSRRNHVGEDNLMLKREVSDYWIVRGRF
jgi:hypothetical protein